MKRLWWLVWSVVVGVLGVEVWLRKADSDWLVGRYREWQGENVKDTGELGRVFGAEKYVLHPYLGFVRDWDEEAGVNKFGFLGPEPVQKKSEEKLIVGVFGGSVALETFLRAEQTLERELKKLPPYSKREVVVVSVAQGGYKQPQQLMALSYLLALGGEFDVVINIDGFNEVALSYGENFALGVSSFYPRSWGVYANKALGVEGIRQVMEGEKIKQGNRLPDWLVSRSALAWLINENWKGARQRRLIGANQKLLNLVGDRELSYQVAGPRGGENKSEEELVDEVVEVWKNSSIQMQRLAAENGFVYLHGLQPNQYVPGSKNLTERERKYFYLDYGEALDYFRVGVEKGYLKLVEAGKVLVKEGVGFVDLTDLFLNEEGEVYRDSCCHYTDFGYELLAKTLVEKLEEELAN